MSKYEAIWNEIKKQVKESESTPKQLNGERNGNAIRRRM